MKELEERKRKRRWNMEDDEDSKVIRREAINEGIGREESRRRRDIE